MFGGRMGNHGEEIVLSLPISSTYELTTKYRIHACPDEGKVYSSYKATKYMTFRKKLGIMEYLYAVQSIEKLFPRVEKGELDRQIESIDRSPDIKDRLRGYISDRLRLPNKEMAFTLHKDGSKKLYRFYLLENEIRLTQAQVLKPNTQNPKYYRVSELLGDDDQSQNDVDMSGLEGRVEEAKYLRRVRNRDLVEERKKIDNNTCQVCGFTFEIRGKHIIDCHHLRPLSTIENETVTNIEDLICLCPNCHRLAHSRTDPYGVKELRALIGHNKALQRTA
jgi:hypothetical protein